MPFGVYKPGQGYWVRVLTAAFAGIIVAVGCAWLWRSLGAVDLPKPTWVMNVTPAKGVDLAATLTPGKQVSFLGDPAEAGATPPEIGTAEVVSVATASSGSNRQVTVKRFTLNPKEEVGKIRSVAADLGGVSMATVVGMPRGKPIFELLYLQAAGVGVLVLVGAVAVFWFVGSRHSSVEFLIATDGEMKKVNWSTKKDIIGSTKVVILWCVILVGGLFVVDLAFSSFFRLIGVLQTSK